MSGVGFIHGRDVPIFHFYGLMTPKKSTGGRPAKFAEPSRPVTVTLPERILRQLDETEPLRNVETK